MNAPRLDKYLWAIRVFKTRSEAAEACKGGRVKVNGIEAKASREIKLADVLTVRKGPILYSYKVLDFLENRVAAKNLEPYMLDITPAEELAKGEKHNETVLVWRERGAGRPTKKERRDIDRLMEGFPS
jgi:Ribosome-associated heat shock protein implicated in the recycling of the 50S subunit (S4 paralog)